jgi:protein-S-isoprenylcysteine O-methyltransferase Ste14
MSEVSAVSPAAFRRLKGIVERVMGFALVAGALLLGWGWDQVLVFFSHPARAAVLAVLALQFALSVAQAVMGNPVVTRPRRRLREPFFMVLLGGAALMVMASPYFDGRVLLYLPGGDLTRYLGLLMFLGGAILATWAQRHFGRFFGGEPAIQEGRQLITDGPFARIRHPRYAGLILMFVGLPLVFLSKVGLAGGLACLVLFVVRLHREEKRLAGEFGGDWAHYAGATKRIIPWVY